MSASGSKKAKKKQPSKKAAAEKDETKKAKDEVEETEAEAEVAEDEGGDEDEDDEKEEKAAAKKSHEVDESLEPFLEGNHETRMTFDSGGFPLYVKAVWAVFLVSITYYMYVYALPDLTAWGSP